MSEKQYIPVASLADLPEGKARKVEAGGTSLLLCHSQGRIFAVAERCSHADEPLECGLIRHGSIACPAHGARFDLETGEPLNPPATDPIATYPARIVDGHIEVLL